MPADLQVDARSSKPCRQAVRATLPANAPPRVGRRHVHPGAKKTTGGAGMVNPDDDPVARSSPAPNRAERYSDWLAHLPAGDPAFAEASALYPPDMGEWQSAVYLLTGNDGVWGELGAGSCRALHRAGHPGARGRPARLDVKPGGGDAVGRAFLGRRSVAGEVPVRVRAVPLLSMGRRVAAAAPGPRRCVAGDVVGVCRPGPTRDSRVATTRRRRSTTRASAAAGA